MKVQGEFKMQAHIRIGCVVMDIAAFKVSHSVDKDAAALRAARARSSSIHRAMDNRLRKVQNAIAHSIALRTHTKHSLSIQRMDESSRKVQNASSHSPILRTRKAHGQISGAMEESSGRV